MKRLLWVLSAVSFVLSCNVTFSGCSQCTGVYIPEYYDIDTTLMNGSDSLLDGDSTSIWSLGRDTTDMFKLENYYFEYRVIPELIDLVDRGKNPIQSLMDAPWIRMVYGGIDIKWEEFRIGVLDENFKKATPGKGKYIVYYFPQSRRGGDAKYGVIVMKTLKYFTLEKSYNGHGWVIGSQGLGNNHSSYGLVKEDLSMEEFLDRLQSFI